MKYFRCVCPIGVLLLFCGAVQAQETKMPLVTATFDSIPADLFLRQLEKQTGYHFYYDTARLDSVRITLSVSGQPLLQVLELAFKNTGVGFSVDKDKNIFVNKGVLVQTSLARNFFTGGKAGWNDTAAVAGLDLSPEQQVTATSKTNFTL